MTLGFALGFQSTTPPRDQIEEGSDAEWWRSAGDEQRRWAGRDPTQPLAF